MVGTMLLDVAVYPNLICSLMHHLGSMAPAQAWKSAQCGNVTSRCGAWRRARARALDPGLWNAG
ncbi:MAG: hypothetical protein WCE49_16065 [Terrimicrobiaceae bacterium]